MSLTNRRRAWLAPLLIGALAGTTALAADVYDVETNHTYPSVETSHMGISRTSETCPVSAMCHTK